MVIADAIPHTLLSGTLQTVLLDSLFERLAAAPTAQSRNLWFATIARVVQPLSLS